MDLQIFLTNMEGTSYETDAVELVGDEATSESEVEAMVASSSTAQASVVDVSYQNLTELPGRYFLLPTGEARRNHAFYHPRKVMTLSAHHNRLESLPTGIGFFNRLVELDLSYNALTALPESIGRLEKLRTLSLKNNLLETDGFPKSLSKLKRLESLTLSGNRLSELPPAILQLTSLTGIWIGANQLNKLPVQIGRLQSLETLYLGGNHLRSIPDSIGELWRLSALHLSDNRLETIPPSVANLMNLQSLSLHNNQLRTLPPEIVKLNNLQQLSLRNNPLVYRFAMEVGMEPPSLLELAGRIVRVKRFNYADFVPVTVADYLNSAHECVNPKCKGVYFDARVEHVKFVDFCGKYRVPLLQYLCSPVCSESAAWAITSASSEEEDEMAGPSGMQAASTDGSVSAEEEARLKKVLLG